jgi:hypothetical protein
VQDALEVRVAHADLVHVIERLLDVVDARSARADALSDQSRPAVQVELAHVGRVLGIGEEGERPDRAAGAQAHRDEARRIHAARHLAMPQPRQRLPQPLRIDAIGHAPA